MTIEFRNHYGRKEMSADELAKFFEERFEVCGLRVWFFINGEPFNRAFVVDDEELNISKILFRCDTNSLYPNLTYKYWIIEKGVTDKRNRKVVVDKENIVGYEMVDVYVNGRYDGSTWNVLTK